LPRSFLAAAVPLGIFFVPILLGQNAPPTLIFEHVTVIDATGAKPRSDFSVELDGDRIGRVAKRIKAPGGAQVINAKGKFLIPGLWDMHVHLGFPEQYFALLVANGITGIREMYTGLPVRTLLGYRSRPDVPRIAIPAFLDGPLMVTPGVALPEGAIPVSNEREGRAAVRFLSQGGFDFLKVYNSLPRDAYFAIADEANKLNMPFAGHVPEAVSPLEASEAGQRSEEHLMNLMLACSTNEDALRAERIRVMNGGGSMTNEERFRLLAFPQTEGLLDTYSDSKCRHLFETFVKNRTWQTPTLVVMNGFAHGDELVKDPRAAYMPREWRATAHPRQKFYMQDLKAEDFDALVKRITELLERHKQLVRDMHKAGVPLLAGTDVSGLNPVLAGFGLHDELALLVECGLTPMEALQTATRNPARYFGLENEFGTVEEGKAADLVLLDADPLKDIHNTQKVRAVVMRGRFFSRSDLETMLARARAQ
jgi:imidazolonepropionase-like amidohydrolase